MRKKIYKTNKGKLIDMEAMRVANERTVAAGNMKVNAKGDELGKGGKVVRTVRERVRPAQAQHKQTARTSIRPPLRKTDTAVNAPVKEEPIVEDNLPTSISERTREDGSVYKEILYADGSIEIEEVKAAPAKKISKKKKK